MDNVLVTRPFIQQKGDTSTLSDLHKFHAYTNNHIFLIYNELWARWEVSTKIMFIRWHEGHPKIESMHGDDGKWNTS